MRLFGEYLVEKGLITEEALVDTLIFQVRSLPSVAEVIRDKKLLSTSLMIDVFRHQHRTGASFFDALRVLGKDETELRRQVDEHLRSVRTPLGEILVSRGITNLDAITKALDEFLGEVASAPRSHQPSSGSDHPLGSFEVERKQFLESLTVSSLGIFDVAFTAPIGEPMLKNLRDEVRKLRGGARLGHLEKTEKFLESFESLVEELIKRDMSAAAPDFLKKLVDLGAQVKQALLDISGLFASGQAESDGPVRKELAERLVGLSASCEVAKFDAEFLSPRSAA